MEAEILHNSDNLLVAHIPHAGAIVTSRSTPGAKPSMPTVVHRATGTNDVEFWGQNNNFPQEIIELYSKNTLIPRTLHDKAAELVGGGLIAVQLTDIVDGQEQYTYVNDPEINAFLNDFQLQRTIFELAQDLVWFANAFVELIPSQDRSRIAIAVHQEAAYCRWSKQNAQGICEQVWLCADFPQYSPDSITRLEAINPYAWDSITRVKEGTGNRYMYPINLPSPGKTFYQLAYHDSVRTSGWLDLVQNVPRFKNYLMKNQMNIKYHFEVDNAYWPAYFGEKKWEEASAKARLELKRKWVKDMTAALADIENAGSAVVTEKIFDQHMKEYRNLVDIHVLNDATKDGKYIEDILEGSAQLAYALGVDPTTFGFAGGAKMGSRSGGSDKREAYLIGNIRAQPARNFLLEPLRWIFRYNGWEEKYPGIRILTKDTYLSTLDTGYGAKNQLNG